MGKNLLWILFLIISYKSVGQVNQDQIDERLLRDAQRSVCFIKIVQNIENKPKYISSGCGVIINTIVEGKAIFFCATAYHVIEDLIKMKETFAIFDLFDLNGQMYELTNIDEKNIIWRKESLDAAIIMLPDKIPLPTKLPKDFSFPGLKNLQNISLPKWGEDVFLFGYRSINNSEFIDILKKGIISTSANNIPGYQGNTVFIVDNMANKGMSGGLVFTTNGSGVAIISSYLLENESKIQTSDDLTICLPLQVYFEQMKKFVEENKTKVLEFIK